VTAPCLESQFHHGAGRVLLLRGNVSEISTDDAGSNFFKTYDPKLRAEIGQLAQSLGLAPMLAGEASGLLGVFPIVQAGKQRLVLHLVNYDIDYERDKIRERADLVLNLARPDFLPDNVTARLYVPGGPTRTLHVDDSRGRLMFSIPPLGVSATVVISEQ
jgi:hypothetical protein